MSQAELNLEMPPIRPEQQISTSLPVLIAVPKSKLRANMSSRYVARPHMRISGRTTRRGRRRLRREVRVAGCALLALVPIASACTLGWSNRPDRILACSISDPRQVTADNDGFADAPRLDVSYQTLQPMFATSRAVVHSVGQEVAIPGASLEASVIVPGYVLPDDSREDSVHEGS
jgi:hypothetical protein